MKRKLLSFAKLIAGAAAAAFVVAPLVANAAYTNSATPATFLVSLTIVPNCTISAAAMPFVSSGLLTSAVTQSSTLSVVCTQSTPYAVALDQGTVAGSTVATRLLAGTTSGNTTSTIPFQLYSDAAYSTVWGNVQGTNTVAGTGLGIVQTLTVYGQIPAQTTVPKPDTYSTTITATVYF